MPTNLAIDDKLLNQAVKLGHFKSKREAVNNALTHLINALRRKEILDFAGKIEFDPKYDYKKERKAR